MSIACPYLFEDHCLVSTKLAGIPCPVQEKACERCLASTKPSEVNQITIGVGALALLKAGRLTESKALSKKAFVELRKTPIPVVTPSSSKVSTIGTVLKEIIERETGSQITCGECKKEIEALNRMTSAEVEADIDTLARRILERSKNQAQRWYQRLAAKIIPEFVTYEIKKWIREACLSYENIRNKSTMIWAYGITTVPSRKDDLFPKTLESLKEAGFDSPRIFVDGAKNTLDYDYLGLEVTAHFPALRTAGKWVLSAYELYIRDPTAERFAIFQDDFVTIKNLRRYLELSKYPDKGYQNLYTFPSNQTLSPSAEYIGWYPSNQLGKGAVALVFSNEAIRGLLSNSYLVDRFHSKDRGHRAIDGGIVETVKRIGDDWKEYVHTPSLTQHIGDVSSMGNSKHLKANSFPGEEFNALDLLKRNS